MFDKKRQQNVSQNDTKKMFHKMINTKNLSNILHKKRLQKLFTNLDSQK